VHWGTLAQSKFRLKACRFVADAHRVGRLILSVAVASSALSCLAAAVLVPPSSAAGDATLCRLRSVDQASYVAQNMRILQTLPRAPHTQISATSSYGQSAPDACIPHENGPPYKGFMTIRRYTMLSGTTAKATISWYARRLPTYGWTLVSGNAAVGFLTFHRGFASLAVLTYVGGRPTFTVSVDYASLRVQ